MNNPSMLERIRHTKVYDLAHKTPLDELKNLSRRFGNSIWLKREDLQPVFSFKLRGAYNKMALLSPEIRSRGVITASAGNHAQGVAMSAQYLACPAIIVMPITTPEIKITAVKNRQAEVKLFGDSYAEAYEYAKQLADNEGLAFIHPYDDLDVIAGQGTIAMEILDQFQGEIEAIFCTVGGGGLLAGVACYVKALRPNIKVIGVETFDADAMRASLQAGYRVTLKQVGLFADGSAVKQVGEHTFSLCQQYVDEMILVDNDAICAGIKDVFEDTRAILEPAGALALAGLKKYCEEHGLSDKNIIAIASGANMDFDRLRFVAERAEIGENREAILAVTIPEKAGSFRAFCRQLEHHNITEFNYRYADKEFAQVFVGITIQNGEMPQRMVELLNTQGFHAVDLTHNEVAKLHVRHLVGGHAQQILHEKVYRFEFPERPQALLAFLEALHWNISLFHYRNHGADVGRVLVGLQVSPQEEVHFQTFLKELNYPYWEETDNLAYRMFLGK